MSKKHFCVGGPLNGMEATYEQAKVDDYVQFNCAGGGHRTKHAMKLAIRRGQTIIPTMIWLHKSCLVGAVTSPPNE